jgi:hypothetical protein
MSERIVAGAMNWSFYDEDMKLFLSANSLTDSGINASVSEDVIRGGKANARLGSYFYDSNLGLTLTSPVFSLDYFKAKFNADITMGGIVEANEEITTTVLNEITVVGTPVAPYNNTVISGNYKVVGTNVWASITFVGKTATVTDLPIGSKVCVKYFALDSSAKLLTINSTMIPKVAYAIGVADEFKSGSDLTTLTSSAKVGELQVIVPKFQFDPNTDMALTSSGHANISLSGNALINYDASCTVGGYYAKIVETTTGGDAFTNCIAIGIADADVELSVGDTETLKVYGFYNDASPSLLDNSLLTFTSDTVGVATAGAHTGLITGIGVGNAIVSVIATSKPTLSTMAVVEVTT